MFLDQVLTEEATVPVPFTTGSRKRGKAAHVCVLVAFHAQLLME